MRKLSGFITESKFLIDIEVLTAASKVLYLINLIKNESKFIEKYDRNNEIPELTIPMEYRKRVKRIEKYNKK